MRNLFKQVKRLQEQIHHGIQILMVMDLVLVVQLSHVLLLWDIQVMPLIVMIQMYEKDHDKHGILMLILTNGVLHEQQQ